MWKPEKTYCTVLKKHVNPIGEACKKFVHRKGLRALAIGLKYRIEGMRHAR
jgi:hypothetical protein